MRITILVLSVLAVTACESAEDKCNAARSAATNAIQPVADEALAAQREAEQARNEAMAAAARATIDLGNVRSDASVEAFGRRSDAPVGIEVAIGAILAAMLSIEELVVTDAATADRVTAAVNEELGGRFGELMTADLEASGAEELMAQAGDASSTRLQLLVRELPERVRARALDTFATMQTGEGEPAEGTSFERVRERWAAYQTARAAAAEAQEHAAAAARALEAVTGEAAALRTAAESLPQGAAEARTAALAAADACAEL
jgi:hypothetical protein